MNASTLIGALLVALPASAQTTEPAAWQVLEHTDVRFTHDGRAALFASATERDRTCLLVDSRGRRWTLEHERTGRAAQLYRIVATHAGDEILAHEFSSNARPEHAVEDAHGRVWFASSGWLRCFDGDSWHAWRLRGKEAELDPRRRALRNTRQTSALATSPDGQRVFAWNEQVFGFLVGEGEPPSATLIDPRRGLHAWSIAEVFPLDDGSVITLPGPGRIEPATWSQEHPVPTVPRSLWTWLSRGETYTRDGQSGELAEIQPVLWFELERDWGARAIGRVAQLPFRARGELDGWRFAGARPLRAQPGEAWFAAVSAVDPDGAEVDAAPVSALFRVDGQGRVTRADRSLELFEPMYVDRRGGGWKWDQRSGLRRWRGGRVSALVAPSTGAPVMARTDRLEPAAEQLALAAELAEEWEAAEVAALRAALADYAEDPTDPARRVRFARGFWERVHPPLATPQRFAVPALEAVLDEHAAEISPAWRRELHLLLMQHALELRDEEQAGAWASRLAAADDFAGWGADESVAALRPVEAARAGPWLYPDRADAWDALGNVARLLDERGERDASRRARAALAERR